ncbi:MAG: hypothetical protein PHC90_00730 [Syntrophorhabdaceae bacterium]|jgi:hypothetical protein|nr:hypothetical protein [Syntrophorhabdaceae bacterium]
MVCRICEVELVDRFPSDDDEGEAYFHEYEDKEDSLDLADHAVLVEVTGDEELTVVRSVLIDAGIPFVVKAKGAEQEEIVNSDRAIVHARIRITVPKEYLRAARDILYIRVYRPVSELRVRALETKLFSDIIWSAVWCVAGFGIACFLVPDDWDQGLKFLVYAGASLAAVSLGNAMRRSRRKTKDGHPWLD